MIPAIGRYRGGGGGGDPYFANVSLLMYGDGVDGGTTFTDDSSHAFTCTPTAGATTSTTQGSPFGAGSAMHFNGAAYVTVPDAPALDLSGTIDWTVEFWVYVPTGTGGYEGIFTKRQPGGDTGYSWLLNPGLNPTLYYTGSVTSNGSITAAGWHFVAFSRTSSSMSVYVDGTRSGSVAIGDFASNPYDCIVGSGRQDEYFLDGYVSNLRITKGVGRYTASTCPVPTGNFPNF